MSALDPAETGRVSIAMLSCRVLRTVRDDGAGMPATDQLIALLYATLAVARDAAGETTPALSAALRRLEVLR